MDLYEKEEAIRRRMGKVIEAAVVGVIGGTICIFVSRYADNAQAFLTTGQCYTVKFMCFLLLWGTGFYTLSGIINLYRAIRIRFEIYKEFKED